MTPQDESRDLAGLVVAQQGRIEATQDPFEPYRLRDPAEYSVGAVAAFLGDLQACGRPATTQRSYAMALLRWFRFLWAIGIAWDEATRVEARDFWRWIQLSGKPLGLSQWHGGASATAVTPEPPLSRREPMTQTGASGATSPVTGKQARGLGYAPATRAHSETVLRSLLRGPPAGRLGTDGESVPVVAGPSEPIQRASQPDGAVSPGAQRLVPAFDRSTGPAPDPRREVQPAVRSARLGSDRDRALVAFWVSTGARASELLGAVQADADPGQQLITVVRKGSRALQQLPASPDAFVWLRPRWPAPGTRTGSRC